MADQNNTVTTADLAAQSIDFVEQFKNGVQGLLNAMQGVRMVPMSTGSVIQTYKDTTALPDNKDVGEGELIPLTKVSRVKDKAYTLKLNDKLRKMTSFEAIQQNGFNLAVSYTDQKLLNVAQMDAKAGLFEAMGSDSTTQINATGLQSAIARGVGKVTALFEDTDGVGATVAFVNPEDFYDWLGNQQITVQTQFGMSYIKNFLNVNTLILSNSVPTGKVYVTVNNNLAFYYVDMNGDAGQALDMETDQTGLIGVAHDKALSNAGYETLVLGGWLLIPERTDGIVTVTVSAPKASTPSQGSQSTTPSTDAPSIPPVKKN